MRKTSIADYFSYISVKFFGGILRLMPLGACFYLGELFGTILYHLDYKHRAIAYANIKRALGDQLSSRQIKKLVWEFYLNFGKNLLEIFLIPRINKEFIARQVEVQGREFVDQAFKKGKGVILLGVHAGSWEFSNCFTANLGFTLNLLVRDQKMPLLNNLLNSYRESQGCVLIQRQNQTRALIEALKKNQAVGMTIDQGGKNGELVNFFRKSASMATGAIRIALKHGAVILPAYYTRDKLRYRIIFEPPFDLREDQSVLENLKRLIPVYEKNIIKYPKEYFWSYKIWKYSDQRNILILSDRKAGHLGQAEALAGIIRESYAAKNIKVEINTIEIKTKKVKFPLTCAGIFAGRYSCQGCLWCLRTFLQPESFEGLIKRSADIVISAGSSLAAINYIISRGDQAKSIVVMRPGIFSARRFDLVIAPEHDRMPKMRNVIETKGSLNLVDGKYLEEKSGELITATGNQLQKQGLYLGLLIGGDTKSFHLSKSDILTASKQIKQAAARLDAGILVTTSRRTSREIEQIIKAEFEQEPRCKLLIIANQKNLDCAVGGILGMSSLVVTSPESITMISEAVSSGKYTLVFDSPGVSLRHRRFLESMARGQHIYLTKAAQLQEKIEEITLRKPTVSVLEDRSLVKEAIEKII